MIGINLDLKGIAKSYSCGSSSTFSVITVLPWFFIYNSMTKLRYNILTYLSLLAYCPRKSIGKRTIIWSPVSLTLECHYLHISSVCVCELWLISVAMSNKRNQLIAPTVSNTSKKTKEVVIRMSCL